MVKNVTVSPPVSTNDHCTISLELSFHTTKSHTYERTMWDFKHANFDLFRNCLKECNWQECFLYRDSIDDVTEAWTSKLLSIAKETIPNKKVRMRPNDKPWYNNALRQLCRKKDRSFANAKKLNTIDMWNKYKIDRNKYFNDVSETKNKYNNEKYKLLANEDNSSKKWWSLIKRVQKSNDLMETIPPLDTDGDILTDDKEKAEAFNNFFQKASTLDETNALLPDDIFIFQHGLPDIEITDQDVIDQIKALDTSKSYGPDLVSPRFLKEGCHELAESLVTLFNMSLDQCKVPKTWKMANVVPIHKKDAKNVVNNYRPVSLLSSVGKIMERIIFKHVYNYFRENFVISAFQSGFLPGRSTVTQLLEVYHEFCKAVDDGKEIRVVFLDISKAFDKVWHGGLIYKLKKCGIHGRLLEWFKDYLKDRLQRVIINGQFSEWVKILAGVPQGSVLGPLLFLIFIDDIVHAVTHSRIRLFADDTCLFLEIDDRKQSAYFINEDLKNIGEWSHQWLVNFSPPKTKSLIISNKHNAHLNPQVQLFGQNIEEVESHVYLGLRFSKNLRWKHHIHDITQKARKKLNLMVPLKYKLDRKSLEIMYRSFVLPSIEYANVVWGGSYDNDIMKLEIIHVDAMRLITGATARSNIANLYEECNWMSVKDRIDNASLVMMYKVLNGLMPTYLSDLVQHEEEHRPYNFRKRKVLKESLCRLDIFSRSFFPRVSKLWNNLSHNIQSAASLEEFKSKLKPEQPENIVLYYYGERWPAVHHARMRIGCSKLNSDLCYNLHVINNPSCACGAENETAQHFFFECLNFTQQRNDLENSVQAIAELDIRNLLYFDPNLSLEQNKRIIDAVHTFINSTGRFH